jgi:hypothetical protein
LITLRHYTISDSVIEYEPKDYMGNLDWFHLAECARKRMSQHCQDIPRWRGERRSFYSSLAKIYEVNFQD